MEPARKCTALASAPDDAGWPSLTFPEEVTSATHIRNGLSVDLGAAWKESMASRRVGPSYQDDSAPPSVLLETFSAERPDAGRNRTWWSGGGRETS